MTAQTILHDGRRVQADECRGTDFALFGPNGIPEILPVNRCLRIEPGSKELVTIIQDRWFIVCQCCGGSGEHVWSPLSDHRVHSDNGGHYGCEPCKGTGEFKVVT